MKMLEKIASQSRGQPFGQALMKVAATDELMTEVQGDERPDDMFLTRELVKGMRIEMEHTDEPEEAKEIAKDHLIEDPRYYTKLEKCEAMTPGAAPEGFRE